MNQQEKLQKVLHRLERLLHHQEKFKAEIHRMKKEVLQLQQEIRGEILEQDSIISTITTSTTDLIEDDITPIRERLQVKAATVDTTKETSTDHTSKVTEEADIPPTASRSMEEYIGGNLINKIGIVILIIGLGLFVKYAIDNGLLPPVVRVILGFIAGGALIGTAWNLQDKYMKYAAVLFSGGMATLYFTAFLAHSFFVPPVLPRMFSFALMEIFTIVMLIAAARYQQQVIGLIGMVGAYAVPLLLSNNSGDYMMFLAYVSVVNLGILSLAAFQNWRETTYSAFVFTWVIFAGWMFNDFSATSDLAWGWFFSTFFFVLFYAAFVVYQFLNKQTFNLTNIAFIFINAFIFYGLNLALLDMANWNGAYGLFTLLNGCIHLGVGYAMYQQLENEQPLHILASLFIFFLTIAIPIQFEAILPMIALWTAEAVALFFIADKVKTDLYRMYSYLVLGLAGTALLAHWGNYYYNGQERFMPIINLAFLGSILVMGGVAAMNWLEVQKKTLAEASLTLLSALFVALLYLTLFGEIYHVFAEDAVQAVGKPFQQHIIYIQVAWLFCYTFAFLTALGVLNLTWLKNKNVRTGLVALNMVMIVPFMVFGILSLNELRSAYAGGGYSFYYIFIRYICYAFLAALVYTTYLLFKDGEDSDKYENYVPLFYHGVILIILSSELTTMLLLSGVGTESLSHRVGYSILWGLYALLLTVLGFWKKNPLLRYASMGLFGVTLMKVFFVDLVGISTTSRMVVFISLGVLLLVISYLYQRFFQEEG